MQIGVTEDTMMIALAVLRELLWDQECALVFLPGLQEITAMMDLLSDHGMAMQSAWQAGHPADAGAGLTTTATAPLWFVAVQPACRTACLCCTRCPRRTNRTKP